MPPLFGDKKTLKRKRCLGNALLPATVGKLWPHIDCLHVHFHCETAGAQHKVATKSATHVIPVLDVKGVLCSSVLCLMTTHQEGAASLLPECSVAAQIRVGYTYTHSL